MNASDDQVRTFWAQLADRRWDDPRELIHGRCPRPNYLWYINRAYKSIKNGTPDKKELSDVIDDLYCFNGYEVEHRLRAAI